MGPNTIFKVRGELFKIKINDGGKLCTSTPKSGIIVPEERNGCFCTRNDLKDLVKLCQSCLKACRTQCQQLNSPKCPIKIIISCSEKDVLHIKPCFHSV